MNLTRLATVFLIVWISPLFRMFPGGIRYPPATVGGSVPTGGGSSSVPPGNPPPPAMTTGSSPASATSPSQQQLMQQMLQMFAGGGPSVCFIYLFEYFMFSKIRQTFVSFHMSNSLLSRHMLLSQSCLLVGIKSECGF